VHSVLYKLTARCVPPLHCPTNTTTAPTTTRLHIQAQFTQDRLTTHPPHPLMDVPCLGQRKRRTNEHDARRCVSSLLASCGILHATRTPTDEFDVSTPSSFMDTVLSLPHTRHPCWHNTHAQSLDGHIIPLSSLQNVTAISTHPHTATHTPTRFMDREQILPMQIRCYSLTV
jgi:hypothetical protein